MKSSLQDLVRRSSQFTQVQKKTFNVDNMLVLKMIIKHRPASCTFDIIPPISIILLYSIFVGHLKPCLLFMTVFLSSLFSLSLSLLSPLRAYSHTCLRSTIVHGDIPAPSQNHVCVCAHMYVLIRNGGQLNQSCVRCSCCVAVS